MIFVDVHYEDCCCSLLALLHGRRQRLTSQSRRSGHTPLYIFVLESATLLTATSLSLFTLVCILRNRRPIFPIREGFRCSTALLLYHNG